MPNPPFFRLPFAHEGEKQAVPFTLNPDGYVSFPQGFGFDYERDASPDNPDPLAKNIERGKMNWLLWAITSGLRQFQAMGCWPYIEAGDNGGQPFVYNKGATCLYDDGNGMERYESLADDNTSPPTDAAKWRRPSLPHSPATPTAPGIVQPRPSGERRLIVTDTADFETPEYSYKKTGTGTGTLTVKAAHYAEVIVQGGGGGGGGVRHPEHAGGGGGAAGAGAFGVYYLQKDQVVPITVGAGGAGGGVTSMETANGRGGNTSSFGSLLSAIGGGGGGGDYRTGTWTTIHICSGGSAPTVNGPAFIQPGVSAFGQSWDCEPTGGFLKLVNIYSGRGACSLFGRGGEPSSTNRSANPVASEGKSGIGYGSGGSGGSATGGAGATGGSGAPGCIYLRRIG